MKKFNESLMLDHSMQTSLFLFSQEVAVISVNQDVIFNRERTIMSLW